MPEVANCRIRIQKKVKAWRKNMAMNWKIAMKNGKNNKRYLQNWVQNYTQVQN